MESTSKKPWIKMPCASGDLPKPGDLVICKHERGYVMCGYFVGCRQAAGTQAFFFKPNPFPCGANDFVAFMVVEKAPVTIKCLQCGKDTGISELPDTTTNMRCSECEALALVVDIPPPERGWLGDTLARNREEMKTRR